MEAAQWRGGNQGERTPRRLRKNSGLTLALGTGDHENLELRLYLLHKPVASGGTSKAGWGGLHSSKPKPSQSCEILSFWPPWSHVTVLLIESGNHLKGRGDEDKIHFAKMSTQLTGQGQMDIFLWSELSSTQSTSHSTLCAFQAS